MNIQFHKKQNSRNISSNLGFISVQQITTKPLIIVNKHKFITKSTKRQGKERVALPSLVGFQKHCPVEDYTYHRRSSSLCNWGSEALVSSTVLVINLGKSFVAQYWVYED
ncbi:hypothetical protein M9H77_29748 [Catharanthus roseus]|uniref:Uncharacterized protein n=1 Tax=Catharanthus roseus TaxID=4058 RepID=A0ACB9ZZ59_CATRO|nr:hypothetical protein M9H77_29748 [Catharanthus roseus]